MRAAPAKRWNLLPAPPAGFGDELGLPPFSAHLLYNRGIRRRAEADAYLAADAGLANDPSLLPDMPKAVYRLRRALGAGETVAVFGDFDTDGITATALVARALRDLGARVVTYLPDRVAEGHGLNEPAIRLLREQGASLLVTVDCGATAVGEVGLAASLGMDTIVTDHHTVTDDRPDAYALVDPMRADSTYPYPNLTGAGIAFKLAEALYSDIGEPRPDHLLELAALGTIADVGPLTGENRYLVRAGLARLNATRNPGIRALVASAGLKLGSLDAESLAFGLVPRLNASGRLGPPTASMDLLAASDVESARPLARTLEHMNSQRQMLTRRGIGEAESQIQTAAIPEGKPPSLIIVASEEWLPGILGLIAGKLSDSYRRPAIAISLGPEVSRASARSVPGLDITELLRRCDELFSRFGGHAQAAGFSLPTTSLPDLKRRLLPMADERLWDAEPTPAIDIDCEVAPALFAGEGLDFIKSMAPLGAGNPPPVFVTRKARVVEARQVGKHADHLKMRVLHEGSTWDVIAFRQGDRLQAARDRIDLVYSVGEDNWGGRPRIQLKALDFRPSR